MKYSKLLRAISDSNRVLTTSGGFSEKLSSIYEENPSDPKTDIPAIHDSSDDDDDKKDFLSQHEWYNKVMRIYEKKNPVKAGRVFEPSQNKISKLTCLDQAKIIIRKNQISVA